MDVNQHQHCPRFLASLSLDNLRRQLFEPMGSSEFSDFLKLGISTASAATRETTGKPREAFAEAKTETERETNAQGQAQDGGSSQAHLVEGDHSRRQRVSAPKTEPFLLPRVRGARRPAGRVRPSLRPREDRGRSAGHPAMGFRSDALVSSRLSSSSSNSTTTTSCSSLLPFFVCLAPCCVLFARPPQRRQDLPDAPVR